MKLCPGCQTILVLDEEKNCWMCPTCGAELPCEKISSVKKNDSQKKSVKLYKVKCIVCGKQLQHFSMQKLDELLGRHIREHWKKMGKGESNEMVEEE